MSDSITLDKEATVRDAIQVIESSRMSLAVMLDHDGKIKGTITDGDVRRALLAGHGLEDSADVAINQNPIIASIFSSEGELNKIFLDNQIEAIPLVDASNKFVRVAHVSSFRSLEEIKSTLEFSAAVIMAGGEGQRLRPITATTPKPMIDVGGMPIIERMVRTLSKLGIPKIYISINYQGHFIENHFKNGDSFGVEIEYLRESEKLGTAGSLSLLPQKPKGPILVVNGDILTASDYGKLLSHHREMNALITVGAVQYQVDIPFGVLKTNGAKVESLAEKPTQRVLCNAGIYVLSPDALNILIPERRTDMTELIENATIDGKNVVAFPIHEYWSDIGSPPDLEKARIAISSEPADV